MLETDERGATAPSLHHPLSPVLNITFLCTDGQSSSETKQTTNTNFVETMNWKGPQRKQLRSILKHWLRETIVTLKKEREPVERAVHLG
jgi:hypothetical protein